MEKIILAFNHLNSVANQSTDALTQLAAQLEAQTIEHNQMVEEYNAMLDKIEALEAEKAQAAKDSVESVKDLLKQRDIAIKAYEERTIEVNNLKNKSNLVNKTLKDLQALDPQRLAKNNKTLKARIIELKAKLESVDSDRREALAQHKTMLKKASNMGAVSLHVFDNGNTLRFAPNVYIRPGNDFDAADHTPVVEFFHQKAGVMRLGNMLRDGSIGWAAATNSMPTQEESNLALFKIHEFCDNNKIKYPKSKSKV